MKKIIYSLVIMIAAGSLFTSCIEQLEPAGILDLRNAKAEYIRSLTKLRAADAELQLALAEVEKANARYRDAETAYKNAETDSLKEIAALQAEYQRLVNEAKAIDNDFLREDFKVKQQEVLARIEAIQQQMENNRAQHEIDMVKYQQKLAEAQENLRVALRNIALASKELTADEQAVLQTLLTAYEAVAKDVADKQVDVMEKQKAYDDAVADMDTVNYDWDSESHAYVYRISLWEQQIEALRAAQDKYREAIENMPTQPQIEEWDAYLKQYSEDSVALAMQHWQLVRDSATLMVAIHDAADAYKEKFDAFYKENEDLDLKATLDAAVAAGQLKKNADGEYLQAEPKEPKDPEGATTYKTVNEIELEDGTVIPAGATVGIPTEATGVLEFPELEINPASKAYQKFSALLASYNPVTITAADGSTSTLKVVDPSSGSYVVDASLDMADFLVGETDKGNVGTQILKRVNPADGKSYKAATADYGLRGALSVLKRQMVLEEEEGTDYDAELKKAKEKWEADRAALKAVYDYSVKEISAGKTTWSEIKATATPKKEAAQIAADWGTTYNVGAAWSRIYTYKPYKDALDAAYVAYEALKEAKDDSVDAMNDLVDAAQNYFDEFNGWANTPADFDKHDSDAIWAAMTNYMVARAAYLNLPANDKDAFYVKHYGKYENPKYYFYAKRSDVTPIEVDSILWTDMAQMKYTDFRTQEDRGAAGKDSKYAFYYVDGKVPTYCTYDNTVFTMIAYQLFNTPAFNGMYAGTSLTGDLVDFINASSDRAIAGTASYQPFKAQVNSKGDVEIVNNDPEIKSQFTTLETAYKNKAKAVQDAIVKFIGVSNDYWGRADAYAADPTTAILVKKLNPECYVLATFMEPFQITVFDGGVLQPTKALQVILGSVDPEKTVTDGSNFDPILGKSQIFGTAKKSDFWNYMYWQSMAGHIDPVDIEDIEKWINEVEAVFGLYELAAATYCEGIYTLDKEIYDTLVANAEEWFKTYGALVGTKENKKGETVLYGPIQPKLTYANEWNCNFLDKNDGFAWIVSGNQLAWAKEVLGEDFDVTLAGLKASFDDMQDQIAHCNIILNAMKPAYVAAAKIANYNHLTTWDGKDTTYYNGADWYALLSEYELAHEKYVNQLNAAIDKAEEDIDDLMKAIADFRSGVAAQEIIIAKAARDLEKAQGQLAQAQAKLAAVQAALENLLAYLEGTGAEFILPEIPGVTGGNSGKIVGPTFDFGDIWFPGGADANVGGTTLDGLIDWIKGIFA